LIKNQSKEDFSVANFEKYIRDLEQRIDSGEIKSGDNIMVILDTHGSNSIPRTITDNDGSFVYEPYIRRLQSKIKGKGINLGILDGGCHSGSALSLADENTCVATVAGPEVGYTGFVEEFLNGIDKNDTMESVFHTAQIRFVGPSSPNISTTANQLTQELLRQLNSSLLNHRADLNLITTASAGFCSTETSVERLLESTSAIIVGAKAAQTARERQIPLREILFQAQSLIEESQSRAIEPEIIERLKKAIVNYEKTRKNLIDSEKEIDEIAKLPSSQNIFVRDPISGKTFSSDYENLYYGNWLDRAQRLRGQESASSVNDRRVYTAHAQKELELRSNDPNYRRFSRAAEKRQQSLDELNKIARQVQQDRKIIYNSAYFVMHETPKTHPCQRFRF
jgi:hypothetical protein